eukprot:scaffold77331_cov21-Tisochrysis_lutea.AAC.1
MVTFGSGGACRASGAAAGAGAEAAALCATACDALKTMGKSSEWVTWGTDEGWGQRRQRSVPQLAMYTKGLVYIIGAGMGKTGNVGWGNEGGRLALCLEDKRQQPSVLQPAIHKRRMQIWCRSQVPSTVQGNELHWVQAVGIKRRPRSLREQTLVLKEA